MDDHRFLELIRIRVRFFLVDEAQLVMPDRDDITMLKRVFLDQLAVDISAVGAVEVLKKRVVQDINDERVVAAHSCIIDADIVIRQAANRVPLLGHVVFRQNLSVEAKHQTRHYPPSILKN